MASVIKPKRSAVAGNIPTTAQIGQYEIAMNTADKKIFTSDGTNIIQIASGTISGLGDVNITSPTNGQSLSYNSSTGKWVNSNAGTGDVVGPASSTDNSVVRFDGTTGKLIQGSPVTISDTGAISGAESISNIDFAQFDTTVTPVEGVAKLQWDDGNGTLQVGLKGGNVNLQVGQEVVARVYNDSGVALTDGQIVYISGSQGNRIAVKLAKADSEATSAGTLGMVTESIAIGAEGFITMTGTVNKLNTSGLTAGALVYLSATTAGAYTTTAPTAPNHRVTLGYVERVDTTVGSIYVKVDNGYELDELHNVSIVTAASGNTLIYDATAGVWENASLTAGTGISVTNGAGSITIGNTGVTSLTGTVNQVTASASTGGVTLSLPSTINVNTSGNAATATTLQTGRTIAMTGDVSYTSGSFNGSANVTGTATLASVGTAGTYTKVTTDAKGRVTGGTTLSASDIPDLTLEKIPDAWVKKAVRAATTANITLSGTQTIDGIAVVAGDRVLVKDQTTASQNGIYVVSATAWARSADADTISELAGACVNVDSGTTNGGFRFDTDLKSTDTLGTTAVSFYRVLDLNDTATTNTANKVVIRDGSGNFSAGTITAALSGNASTASTWQTARTLTIGATGKSVNGSANVSWSLAEIGAAASTHYHDRIYNGAVGTSSYLALSSNNELEYYNSSGVIDTLYLQYSGAADSLRGPAGNIILHAGNYNSYSPSLTGTGASGIWPISISGNADTVDSIHVAQPGVAPSAHQIVRTDGNGYTFVNYINSNTGNSENGTVSQVIITNGVDNYYRKASIAHLTSSIQSNASGSWGISVTGNAATATTLQTARNINGVSFNGSTDITVADNTKLPLSGGTLTGDLIMAGSNSRLPGHFYTNTHDGFNVYFHVGTATSTEKVLNLRVFKSDNNYSTYTFDSSTLNAPNLQVNGNQVLHAGNYSSYFSGYVASGGSATLSLLTVSSTDPTIIIKDTDSGSGGSGKLVFQDSSGTTFGGIAYNATYGNLDVFNTNYNGKVTINGYEPLTVSNYSTTVAAINGYNATGTWPISITGSAASAPTSTVTFSGNGNNTYYVPFFSASSGNQTAQLSTNFTYVPNTGLTVSGYTVVTSNNVSSYALPTSGGSVSGITRFFGAHILTYAPTHTSLSANTTLTNAQLLTQIINTTAAATLTMPTGSTLESMVFWSYTNVCYDFYVINGAGASTLATATGITLIGNMSIAINTSAHFRIRRTAANTFTVYRLS